MTDPRDIRGIYDRQAERYDSDRSRKLVERGWLGHFASGLPDTGRVLDLGCGGGEPIAGWLIDQGFQVTGVDLSLALLDRARSRWPDGDWRQADMRTLDLGERFDGIIGWDSFFHLTAAEQIECLPRLAAHLKPAGSLMLTVGPGEGEAIGTVGGEPIYHASLSPARYATLLEENGLILTAFQAEDADCTDHTVLIARSLEA